MQRLLKFNYIILALAFSLIMACKSKKDIPEGFGVDDHYYSVSQFLDDQWKNKGGNPYVLTKYVTIDGKTDSSFQNWNKDFFHNIRKPFDLSDISDQKFLGKYKYYELKDTLNFTVNHLYEAIDNDLFTQKLLITVDMVNNRILNVYVETLKDGFLKDQTEKLTYIPDHSIQFVTFEKSKLSKAKEVVTLYKFP